MINIANLWLQAQADAMSEDPRVFVFGLDVPDFKRIFGSTKGLLEKFGPERGVRNTPLRGRHDRRGTRAPHYRPAHIHVHIRVDFLCWA